ncbi:MAG: hypothetical protein MUF49_31075 [Oculatellaceae cyanobacterium Prado106]|jgi:hypothetical protein|nr:hypothetical protein [Oculatellaceae cyanobacterium Prado106]
MKRFILAGLSLFALSAAYLPNSPIGDSFPTQETRQALNDRFEEARRENLNSLNDRFDEARWNNLNGSCLFSQR